MKAFEPARRSPGPLRVAALILGITSILPAAGCAGDHATSPTPSAQHYRDPAGWSLRYPAGMHLERSSIKSRLYIREVTVASFVPRRAIRSGSTANSAWIVVDPPKPADGPFPPDGVAFRVYQQEGGPPALGLEVPETHFPLRLSELAPDRFDYANRRPRPVAKRISAAGQNYVVYAWTGPHASPEKRAALAGLVSSLSFPHV